jgi:hypothetical protein
MPDWQIATPPIAPLSRVGNFPASADTIRSGRLTLSRNNPRGAH